LGHQPLCDLVAGRKVAAAGRVKELGANVEDALLTMKEPGALVKGDRSEPLLFCAQMIEQRLQKARGCKLESFAITVACGSLSLSGQCEQGFVAERRDGASQTRRRERGHRL
jgi:hypothetical protein